MVPRDSRSSFLRPQAALRHDTTFHNTPQRVFHPTSKQSQQPVLCETEAVEARELARGKSKRTCAVVRATSSAEGRAPTLPQLKPSQPTYIARARSPPSYIRQTELPRTYLRDAAQGFRQLLHGRRQLAALAAPWRIEVDLLRLHDGFR